MEETELTYKTAMKELESIIAAMESENCEIDRLADYTRQATKLLKYCKESLFKTNSEVENCLEELKRLV